MPPPSRGHLIPKLLSRSAVSLARKDLETGAEPLRPFDLLAFDFRQGFRCQRQRWDGQTLQNLAGPPVLSSSSYLSRQIERARIAYFEQLEQGQGKEDKKGKNSNSLLWPLRRERLLRRGRGAKLQMDYFDGSPCTAFDQNFALRNRHRWFQQTLPLQRQRPANGLQFIQNKLNNFLFPFLDQFFGPFWLFFSHFHNFTLLGQRVRAIVAFTFFGKWFVSY